MEKNIPPKQGKRLTKKIGNNEWHWCEHHMAYTIHKLANCFLGKDHAKEKPKILANAAIKEEDDNSTCYAQLRLSHDSRESSYVDSRASCFGSL